MINSKDHPDYIFEEYNGYTIASHKITLSEKTLIISSLFIVQSSFLITDLLSALMTARCPVGENQYHTTQKMQKPILTGWLKPVRKSPQ